jgi:ribosomal protein L37AE/L43A
MDDLDTPNCPQDLVQMAAVERGREIVWVCPECGLLKL